VENGWSGDSPDARGSVSCPSFLGKGALAVPMAFDQQQILTLAGVLAVLFGVIVFNNVAAARARSANRSKTAGSGDVVHPLLVKFARHDGSVVGETVAIDGPNVILKQAGMFKAVPVAQAQVKEGEVVLEGPIDWAAAEQAGMAWHESRRKADAGVSGTMTTSADVKSPAMDAVRGRDGKS
jgi:prophage tail gpP-like protein